MNEINCFETGKSSLCIFDMVINEKKPVLLPRDIFGKVCTSFRLNLYTTMKTEELIVPQ
jgi:hypothetical protein